MRLNYKYSLIDVSYISKDSNHKYFYKLAEYYIFIYSNLRTKDIFDGEDGHNIKIYYLCG